MKTQRLRGARVWAALAVGLLAAAIVVGGGIAGGEAPPDTPGSQAKSATYFARFGDNGTEAVLVAGKGVVSVSRYGAPVPPAPPGYVVEFAVPIDQCAWTTSINPFFGGPPEGWQPLVVQLLWDNTVPPEDQTPDPYKLLVLGGTPGYPPASTSPLITTLTVSVVC